MKKVMVVSIIVLTMFAMFATPVLAKGPTNAGGIKMSMSHYSNTLECRNCEKQIICQWFKEFGYCTQHSEEVAFRNKYDTKEKRK